MRIQEWSSFPFNLQATSRAKTSSLLKRCKRQSGAARSANASVSNASEQNSIKRRKIMPAKKGRKSGGRRYGKAAGKRVASAMRRRKSGTLRSGKGGKGGKVKSRKQAIAIGLSEARKKGAKVPKKK
jgi:hypothetical protein